MPTFELEELVRARADDPNLIVAGIDEVGVGPLAGPVVAAAVVLGDEEEWMSELDDSKRLRPRKREQLHDIILANAIYVGIGYASNEEIDDYGMAEARRSAVLIAYNDVLVCVAGKPLAAVVDDRRLKCLRADLGGAPSVFTDKADSKSLSVAAASIVAKVIRDRWMVVQDNLYPNYGFAKHKGYGTAQHLEALKRHGATPIHRRSFKPVKSLENSSDLS